MPFFSMRSLASPRSATSGRSIDTHMAAGIVADCCKAQSGNLHRYRRSDVANQIQNRLHRIRRVGRIISRERQPEIRAGAAQVAVFPALDLDAIIFHLADWRKTGEVESAFAAEAEPGISDSRLGVAGTWKLSKLIPPARTWLLKMRSAGSAHEKLMRNRSRHRGDQSLRR